MDHILHYYNTCTAGNYRDGAVHVQTISNSQPVNGTIEYNASLLEQLKCMGKGGCFTFTNCIKTDKNFR